MTTLHLQATGGLFAFIFFIIWWSRSKISSKKLEAPAVSGAWPLIGHMHLLGVGRPLYHLLADMSDKYGPAFTLRIGLHKALVVSSWEFAKECFTTNDRVLATRPSTAGGKYMAYNNALFTFSPYGAYWRDTRKIATLELLSNHRLEQLKHVRAMEINTCIKDLYKPCQTLRIVDLTQWFADLTFNVVVMMVTGKRYIGSVDAADENEIRRFQAALIKFMHLLRTSVVLDAFPVLQWINLGGFKGEMKSTARNIDSVLETWLQEHHRKRLSPDVEGQHDFIDVMISALEGVEFADYDHDTVIKATSMAMIVGGTDTTTTTLTWAVSLLLNNPHALRKVQEELDIHVGKERNVDESDIQQLVYLQAVVKETLRLYPPVPMLVFHQAMEDCRIGGYDIQEGTRVTVNLWKLHRDPSVWADPLEFRPERFLTSHVNVDIRGQHFELIPFGSGRRSCPGISFALQVIHLTVARLLHGFNLATPGVGDSSVDMSEIAGATLLKATPLEVLVVPRLSSKLYK